MATMALVHGPEARIGRKLPLVVVASSVGSLMAWYDFYLFSALALIVDRQFFGPGTGLRLSLAVSLGTGFLARPIGAIVFGHLGDLIGRKHAFVLTLLLLGGSTFIVGLLPSYGSLGVLAPLLLVAMRVIQGLALGGEYGSAATYVAEHAPDGKRGLYTAWIQTTATMGIVLALLVILVCRLGFGDATFADWGWRVPFWISAILVGLSLYIRLKLEESPLYSRLHEQGKTSPNPAVESLSSRKNQGAMLLALFGAAAPEGVVWYTGQFYVLFYLTTVLQIPDVTVYTLMMMVLTLAAPLFVVFGALSDRIGRRNIMVLGFLLAAVSYWPVFAGMAMVKDNPLLLGGLVFYVMVLVAMVYGPIAALLVESFPARIRCTSISLPYHIGNGVFGSLVPLAGAWLATAFGGPLYGLLYPIGIAVLGAVVSMSRLPARSDTVRIWEEVGGAPPLIPNQP